MEGKFLLMSLFSECYLEQYWVCFSMWDCLDRSVVNFLPLDLRGKMHTFLALVRRFGSIFVLFYLSNNR